MGPWFEPGPGSQFLLYINALSAVIDVVASFLKSVAERVLDFASNAQTNCIRDQTPDHSLDCAISASPGSQTFDGLLFLIPTADICGTGDEQYFLVKHI